MRCEPRELLTSACAIAAFTAVMGFVGVPRAEPPPDEIVRNAEQQRGLPVPHMFTARIFSEPATGDFPGEEGRVTVVEVRSNGFAQQLVYVLAPNRGDVMLSTPDVVWLRPRSLHRLTRIPPDLRMFNGASVADVTSIDLATSYTARTSDRVAASGQYRVDLIANKPGMRYPNAAYSVRHDDFRPVQIDFMTASRKVLKTIVYAQFGSALGRVVPTEFVVRDHVYRDSAVVRLSEFRALSPVDPGMFVPDYLLTLGDAT